MSRYGLTEPKRSFVLDPQTPLNLDSNQQSLANADDSFFHLTTAFFNVDGQGGRFVMPQPKQPLLNREAIKQWNISVKERIDQLDISAEEEKILALWMAIKGLTDASKIGFLSPLRLYALSGYDFQQYLQINGTFKIPRGTTALANAIFSEFNGSALFNRKVTSVTSNSAGAQVTIEGGEDIAFSPALLSFTSITHHNIGGKLHAHSSDGFSRFFGVTSLQKAACFGFTESESKAGGTNMILFKGSQPEVRGRSPLSILDDVLQGLKPDTVDLGTIAEYL
ncbi:hypothetical protein EDB81DRAFT_891120 [Dactylonectria macrodidyma]|uniref:Uncharacterized protein n=1 Tax=Dactylonectria macrodidyma TaxID=307937 RepID=A0A9P9IJB9_9HYPO|nr:hypothetical protein EDB81DRAFT_891120 [Dactylonectria macrodidyma]